MATNSQKQERRIAREYGGKVSSGSGNGLFNKNDVRIPGYSLELKYTGAKSFSLKLADLLKAEKHAHTDGREFAFIITMGDRDWVVIAKEDWKPAD